MPLSEQLINEASERYHRERDRYRKLSQLVYDICESDIIAQNAIPAQITHRTKSVASFANKLRRFSLDPGKLDRFQSADDVFRELSDFSGVRIALYSRKDEEFVCDALKARFCGPENGEPIDVDIKDKNTADEYNFYRAIHCQVYLKPQDIIGENENLGGLSCEVQVCTMMAHVWNEIEHDIVYKTSNKPSEEERNFVRALGLLIRNGDEIIEDLFAANGRRLAAYVQESSNRNAAIQSEGELAELIADRFNIKRVTFRSNMGFLFDQLQSLNIVTIEDLNSLFANESWQAAKMEIRKFNTYLNRIGDTRFLLSPTNSADPALWMLLRKRHKELLRTLPAGRGQGRPRLIRSLAFRYEGFLKRQAGRGKGSSGQI